MVRRNRADRYGSNKFGQHHFRGVIYEPLRHRRDFRRDVGRGDGGHLCAADNTAAR